MKKGDIVLNLMAGDKNPHRAGIYISRSEIKVNRYLYSPVIVLLHSDGAVSKYNASDMARFVVIGHVDLKGSIQVALHNYAVSQKPLDYQRVDWES